MKGFIIKINVSETLLSSDATRNAPPGGDFQITVHYERHYRDPTPTCVRLNQLSEKWTPRLVQLFPYHFAGHGSSRHHGIHEIIIPDSTIPDFQDSSLDDNFIQKTLQSQQTAITRLTPGEASPRLACTLQLLALLLDHRDITESIAVKTLLDPENNLGVSDEGKAREFLAKAIAYYKELPPISSTFADSLKKSGRPDQGRA